MLTWLGGDDSRPTGDFEHFEDVLGFLAGGFDELELLVGYWFHGDVGAMVSVV